MIGESSALLAAGIWAVASLLYEQSMQKHQISALAVSFYRGCISLPFFFFSLLFFDPQFPLLNLNQWLSLILSAILGITVGDTAFFYSLENLGVKKAILFQTLTPLFGVVFAWLFLGEILSPISILGILITLTGIIWVITERTLEQKTAHFWKGILWGTLSNFSQALGAILMRFVFNTSDLSSLWSSTLRLLIGTILVLIWLRQKKEALTFTHFSREQWQNIFLASLLGTFIALWLHQTAFLFTPVGIASTLLNTTPLFTLGIGFYRREKISFRAVFGAMVAIFGISLIFLYPS